MSHFLAMYRSIKSLFLNLTAKVEKKFILQSRKFLALVSGLLLAAAVQAQVDTVRAVVIDQHCGPTPGLTIISSAERWHSQLPQTVLPAMDWRRQQILLVRMGTQANPGYQLSYPGGAYIKGKVLTIPVQWHKPDPDRLYAQMLVEPCLALAIPRDGYHTLRVIDQTGASRYEIRVQQ